MNPTIPRRKAELADAALPLRGGDCRSIDDAVRGRRELAAQRRIVLDNSIPKPRL
jgi:hypothetical protein